MNYANNLDKMTPRNAGKLLGHLKVERGGTLGVWAIQTIYYKIGGIYESNGRARYLIEEI